MLEIDVHAARWHSTFRVKVPGTGWAMRWSLKRFIAETADGLARAAETGSTT